MRNFLVGSSCGFPFQEKIARKNTVFARSVAAATNVFNLSWREATIQERLLFESGVYLFDCALPEELNDYVMVFVNV